VLQSNSADARPFSPGMPSLPFYRRNLFIEDFKRKDSREKEIPSTGL